MEKEGLILVVGIAVFKDWNFELWKFLSLYVRLDYYMKNTILNNHQMVAY